MCNCGAWRRCGRADLALATLVRMGMAGNVVVTQRRSVGIGGTTPMPMPIPLLELPPIVRPRHDHGASIRTCASAFVPGGVDLRSAKVSIP